MIFCKLYWPLIPYFPANSNDFCKLYWQLILISRWTRMILYKLWWPLIPYFLFPNGLEWWIASFSSHWYSLFLGELEWYFASFSDHWSLKTRMMCCKLYWQLILISRWTRMMLYKLWWPLIPYFLFHNGLEWCFASISDHWFLFPGEFECCCCQLQWPLIPYVTVNSNDVFPASVTTDSLFPVVFELCFSSFHDHLSLDYQWTRLMFYMV